VTIALEYNELWMIVGASCSHLGLCDFASLFLRRLIYVTYYLMIMIFDKYLVGIGGLVKLVEQMTDHVLRFHFAVDLLLQVYSSLNELDV
jgi:hypothetical protein